MSFYINVAAHVLVEDEYMLAVHKPCGLMVEPDRNGYPNLLHQVQKYVRATPGQGLAPYAQHIHRLDRPVSGIVLFAKQKIVLKNLSEQFAQRKVQKYYQALTTQAPHQHQGELAHWHAKEKKKAVVRNEYFAGAENIKLTYRVEPRHPVFLWNIELHTGRYHQIRSQLAHIGCSILGDTLYGATQPYKPNAIALHACKLVFHHPITNEQVVVEKDGEF